MANLNRFRNQWDRTSAVALALLGFAALMLGYRGVSRSEFVAGQIPYFVSGGLVGLFFLGLAGVLWLSSDLRDEWVKLGELDDHLERVEQALQIRERDVYGEIDGLPVVNADAPATRQRVSKGS